MGVLDNITSTVNKGIAGANRATATMKLKAQISDALKRRQNLAAQLGASLYEATKNNEELRAGREALYDGIAACDAERMEYQAEIERIEKENQAKAEAMCPFCGLRIGANDMFCSGCGKSMEEIRRVVKPEEPAGTAGANVEGEAKNAAVNGLVCPACGAAAREGNMFCMSCGHSLKAAEAEETPEIV